MNNSFYDKESKVYSEKRYYGVTETYVQYFFKNRLKITLDLLRNVLNGTPVKLIDIGCADGIMTRAILKKYPTNFSELVGVDISPEMVETARRLTADKRVGFFLKNGEAIEGKLASGFFDIALGLGYMTPKIFDSELNFLKKYLKPGGYYICSLPAKYSAHARFKLKNAEYRNDYRSYAEYETMLSGHFEILKKVSNSLFVPKLWAIPALARMIQPIVDKVFSFILPGLYHERVYLLKLK